MNEPQSQSSPGRLTSLNNIPYSLLLSPCLKACQLGRFVMEAGVFTPRGGSSSSAWFWFIFVVVVCSFFCFVLF